MLPCLSRILIELSHQPPRVFSHAHHGRTVLTHSTTCRFADQMKETVQRSMEGKVVARGNRYLVGVRSCDHLSYSVVSRT